MPRPRRNDFVFGSNVVEVARDFCVTAETTGRLTCQLLEYLAEKMKRRRKSVEIIGG
jgi:hypothetical protein